LPLVAGNHFERLRRSFWMIPSWGRRAQAEVIDDTTRAEKIERAKEEVTLRRISCAALPMAKLFPAQLLH